jgi:hypothetical protein
MAALKMEPVAALHAQTSRATRRACARRPGGNDKKSRQQAGADKQIMADFKKFKTFQRKCEKITIGVDNSTPGLIMFIVKIR